MCTGYRDGEHYVIRVATEVIKPKGPWTRRAQPLRESGGTR